MSGSVSLAPTNDRHDADRLHPLRRTESGRDPTCLIRTLLRFAAQPEHWAQLADFIGDSQSREARICSVRSDRSSSGLPSSDRLHTSSRRIRAASYRCPKAAAIVARSTRGTGRKQYPRCLASASSDRTVLYGRPSPVRSAPRRLVTPTSVVPVACSPGRTLVAGGLDKSRAAVGGGHSPSSCCPGSADLRAGPAGSSHLTQTTQICFQAPRPPSQSDC